MSDNKEKKLELDDLDFDSLSGGTQAVERAEVPLVSPTDTARAIEKRALEEYIVLQNEDGTLHVQELKDASGSDFLRWAESVYPPLATERANPARFDGPKNLFNKRQMVDAIERYYSDCWARKRLGKKEKSSI